MTEKSNPSVSIPKDELDEFDELIWELQAAKEMPKDANRSEVGLDRHGFHRHTRVNQRVKKVYFTPLRRSVNRKVYTSTNTQQNMVEIDCHKCGYEWVYSGELNRATCPNCGAKVPVEGNHD